MGHRWLTQRWAGLRLNSPGWVNRSLLGEGDDYPTARWTVERLAAELPARLSQLHSAYYSSPDDLPRGHSRTLS